MFGRMSSNGGTSILSSELSSDTTQPAQCTIFADRIQKFSFSRISEHEYALVLKVCMNLVRRPCWRSSTLMLSRMHSEKPSVKVDEQPFHRRLKQLRFF